MQASIDNNYSPRIEGRLPKLDRDALDLYFDSLVIAEKETVRRVECLWMRMR